MEYKIVSIHVPVDAEMFNDTFTPEENYAMLKMGREQIIKQRGPFSTHHSAQNLPILCEDSMRKCIKNEIREKNRQKYKDRLQELEKQVEAMNQELQKYGVIFMPASAK
jgi:ABC-type transport system involved in Fe-S cluster assembly fused permease/ATPase subunit